MIEFVFTLDYEIYGNGSGLLNDLVYGPARRLTELFRNRSVRFVAFVEVAELEKIETYGTDPTIDLVRRQIEEFHRDGFEVGLHLHPQWCNARYDRGAWILDYREYNLCTLPRNRISQIVDGSLACIRQLVNCSGFTPLSFRAGNWLFQPTETAASVLAEKGIRVDSSVFKGGTLRSHHLDYRAALRNSYYWPFGEDVNVPDPAGRWVEVPIYTEMVPFWKMATSKRLGIKNSAGANGQAIAQKWSRIRDRLRFHCPLKLDFCRMTLNELTSMMATIIREDRKDPETFRPIVSIGHTKDLTDFDTVDSLLSFLKQNKIAISTFQNIYPKLAGPTLGSADVEPLGQPTHAVADRDTPGFTA
ncbi:MAG: hypothetical protein LAO56_12785 [Acidobacteriia bacterium]|nr:hypothetical protein [Terriglobia bacterium]